MILTILAIMACLIAFVMLVETVLGLRSMTQLEAINITRTQFPKLSVIVTACNEENTIHETLKRLLNQDYPDLELIVVEDRSTDKTGSIVDDYAARYPAMRVVHIATLPEGWIGKNHAAYQGAMLATGEWLLFLDADALLGKDTLKKSAQYAIDENLDHLSVLPRYICKSFLYQAYKLMYLGHGLTASLKPWLAKSKKSKRSFNLGLFSLVRTSAYQTCGGHAAIANKCIDDMSFARLIKQFGFSQEIVNAKNDVAVAWYDSVLGMIRGLEKNAFEYFNFKVIYVVGALIAWSLFFILPVFALFFTAGIVFYINVSTVLLTLCMYFYVANFFDIPKGYAFFYPIGLIIHPFTLINSVVRFIYHKGIYWRGTFYSEEMLKKDKDVR